MTSHTRIAEYRALRDDVRAEWGNLRADWLRLAALIRRDRHLTRIMKRMRAEQR
jgi:hypothetical protein